MTILRKPLGRRTLLRGAAGVAVSLPFLEAMRPAHAQTTAPKRFVVMFNANGTFAELWSPMGTETAFTLSPILSPLAKHQKDLVVVRGLDLEAAKRGVGSNGHDKGMGCLLTGTELVAGPSGVGQFGHLWDGSAGGISIDQEIAKHVGGKTKFRSLEFGVNAGGLPMAIPNRMSYLAPFQAVPAENKPDVAFTRVFGDLTADPTQFTRLRARRQSVLDSVKGDLDEVMKRVGATDRQRLDAHLTAVREIEGRLASAPAAGAGTCKKPVVPSPVPRDYPTVGALQIELLVMALACDLTRVASLQWSTAQSGVRFGFLGITEDHHSLSHSGDSDTVAKEKLTKIQQWYAGQLATMLDRMKSYVEGTGTLLDSTLVLWANELGRGNSHTHNDIPFVLAGRAGGALRTGRYLSYTTTANNNLFVSLLNLMGIPATTFGNPKYCTGPLAGLA